MNSINKILLIFFICLGIASYFTIDIAITDTKDYRKENLYLKEQIETYKDSLVIYLDSARIYKDSAFIYKTQRIEHENKYITAKEIIKRLENEKHIIEIDNINKLSSDSVLILLARYYQD